MAAPPGISQSLGLPPPPTKEEEEEEMDANHEPAPYPSFVERIKIKSPLAQSDFNWSKLAVSFCFGSAIDIANHSHSQHLSTLYLLHCFSISVSFSCILVAKFMGSRFSTAALVLEYAGVLFAVTAFFLAVTSPFPVSLKGIVWALYAVSFLAILISNLYSLVSMPSK